MGSKQRGERPRAARQNSAEGASAIRFFGTDFLRASGSSCGSSGRASSAGAPRPRDASASLFAGLFWALVGFGLLGCGSPRELRERQEVVPVAGQLMFQGRPAAGALVVLHPIGAGFERREWTAGFPRGRAAEDGSFRLTTYEQDDGAPRGKYVLLVSWSRSWKPEAVDVDSVSEERGGEDWLAGRFADPHVSPLSCVVEGSRADLGRIDLH